MIRTAALEYTEGQVGPSWPFVLDLHVDEVTRSEVEREVGVYLILAEGESPNFEWQGSQGDLAVTNLHDIDTMLVTFPPEVREALDLIEKDDE